jgi:hypothetical protein
MRNRYSALLNQSKKPTCQSLTPPRILTTPRSFPTPIRPGSTLFWSGGGNSVERKPFKPLFLIFLLMAVVAAFSLLSQGIAQWAGIY